MVCSCNNQEQLWRSFSHYLSLCYKHLSASLCTFLVSPFSVCLTMQHELRVQCVGVLQATNLLPIHKLSLKHVVQSTLLAAPCTIYSYDGLGGTQVSITSKSEYCIDAEPGRSLSIFTWVAGRVHVCFLHLRLNFVPCRNLPASSFNSSLAAVIEHWWCVYHWVWELRCSAVVTMLVTNPLEQALLV